MDPDACLAKLLDAFRDGDREAAYEAIEDLSDWLAKGGFMPADPRITLDDFIRQVKELTALLNEYRDSKAPTDEGTPF
jgi:hypothetical protein